MPHSAATEEEWHAYHDERRVLELMDQVYEQQVAKPCDEKGAGEFLCVVEVCDDIRVEEEWHAYHDEWRVLELMDQVYEQQVAKPCDEKDSGEFLSVV